MSRKANVPIPLGKGVEVKVEGNRVTVKGPKGSLQQDIRDGIIVKIEDNQINVSIDAAKGGSSNFQGLYWSLIANMVKGVSDGFVKQLEMIGVGYRAAVQGSVLDLQIGLSHPTKMAIPQGISVAVDKNTMINISGIDKQLVGQFAADIRAKKPPEPYKGKGIRYANEYVRRKAGKSGKK